MSELHPQVIIWWEDFCIWYQRYKFKRLAKQMTTYRKETVQLPWFPLRLDVDKDTDTPLNATSRTLSDIPSHAYELAKGMNAIELKFSADSEDTACTVKVYLTRLGGDIKRICSLAVTSGAQIDSRGDNIADTIVVTPYWHKEIHTSDANGNDHMASLALDVLGWNKIFVLFEFATGATWNCDLSGF